MKTFKYLSEFTPSFWLLISLRTWLICELKTLKRITNQGWDLLILNSFGKTVSSFLQHIFSQVLFCSHFIFKNTYSLNLGAFFSCSRTKRMKFCSQRNVQPRQLKYTSPQASSPWSRAKMPSKETACICQTETANARNQRWKFKAIDLHPKETRKTKCL